MQKIVKFICSCFPSFGILIQRKSIFQRSVCCRMSRFFFYKCLFSLITFVRDYVFAQISLICFLYLSRIVILPKEILVSVMRNVKVHAKTGNINSQLKHTIIVLKLYSVKYLFAQLQTMGR